MVRNLLFIIAIPFIGALFSLIFPKKRGWREAVSFLTSLYTFILAIKVFQGSNFTLKFPISYFLSFHFDLKVSPLSSALVLFVALFGFLIILYSFFYYFGKEREREYYAYLLGVIGSTIGALFSDNIFLFLFFWGLLLLLLYALSSLGSLTSANRALTIVGSADLLLLLGLVMLSFISGHSNFSEIHLLSLKNGLNLLVFFLIFASALAKAGAFPFHSWIPEISEDVPVTVMAILPASLDKLLGIYLLFRLVTEFFSISPGSGVSTVVMFIGALTIIGGVLLALLQHDFKRLLSFHAISQVGYMVLGIGTGVPLAIAGGLFHMINNSIYKSSLFLSSGNVEKQTGTSKLENLGGLGKYMPITFATFLITAFAISGVPPFNGFFSKWMIYQGLVELGKEGIRTWIIWLVAAMFGSALTLASFIKLTHSVFLGRPAMEKKRTEVPWPMWVPPVVLALLCVIFGVFAYPIPLNSFILPVVHLPPPEEWIGWWQPLLSTWLIICGLFLGIIFYLFSKVSSYRVTESYIGGEELTEDMRLPGTHFYYTFEELKGFNQILKLLKGKIVDFYSYVMDLGKFFYRVIYVFLDRLIDYGWRGITAILRLIGKGISILHTGILPTYITWALFGILIILLICLGL